MTEREKVIKGLMCIAGDVVFCAHCKYSDVNGSGRGDRCKRDCAKDALALLKAEKPIAPNHVEDGNYETSGIMNYWFMCGKCGSCVDPGDKYCRECGQAVKWE